MSEVARAKIGLATHLAPKGSLNSSEAILELRNAVETCVVERQTRVVLDLVGVPIVNSEALETFLDAQDELVRQGGGLKLANPNVTVRDVLRITQVSEHIAVTGPKSEAQPPTDPAARLSAPLRIGEVLQQKGLVTPEIIEQALQIQHDTGKRMAEVLVDKGWVTERDLLHALSEQLGVPFVGLRAGLYDPDVVRVVDVDVARRLTVLPLFQLRGILYTATPDPQSIPSMETIEDLTGCAMKPVLAVSEEILKTLGEAHARGSDLAEFVADLDSDLQLVEGRSIDDQSAVDEMAEGSPVINLINGVIQRAVRDGASDIHIEPSSQVCRIRLRIDGMLYNIMNPPMHVHPALVSRLKVMANVDIAERRLPQDGRIQVVTQGRTVDLRFSSLPGIFGEKVVLRVLDKNQAILDIHKLGLRDVNLDGFKQLLGRSEGLVLVTGPTGSGKTTTLYAALHELTCEEKNIVTIEDPVEYQIDAINQNPVRENIGLGFAKILKHVLRQDPDIVMVGEIREKETAEIAVQAALTGHLVLSTLHTNDAIGAVTRLIDMGVEPYLLSSALIGVMAQRLVRRVCTECATSNVVPAESLERYGVKQTGKLRLTKGRGCQACYDSGYKGRMAIHEIVSTDAALQKLVVSSPSRDDLAEHLRAAKIETLKDDGLHRAIEGVTTIEEVLRVVNS